MCDANAVGSVWGSLPDAQENGMQRVDFNASLDARQNAGYVK